MKMDHARERKKNFDAKDGETSQKNRKKSRGKHKFIKVPFYKAQH